MIDDLWIDVRLLARFGAGLAWGDIPTLDPLRSRGWWRHAVAAAEERGHLEWDARTRTWRLTAAGTALVCARSPG